MQKFTLVQEQLSDLLIFEGRDRLTRSFKVRIGIMNKWSRNILVSLLT